MPENEDLTDGRVGKTVGGKWKLERLIGVGGMAAVYAASHRNGATAAIKILHPEFARRTEARNRFLREAYIANKAGKGAVAVLDDDVDDDGAPYLVMELLRGEPVDIRAERLGGHLPPAEVLWVASQTLATLECAHDAGIVHRDLKPENLFWTTDERIKVLDFGIARLRDSTAHEMTKNGMIMGTPAFMAPEQAIGAASDIDARTDIFSVGAIMFRLLTGRDVHAFDPGNVLVTAATKHAPSVATVDSTLPRDIVKIVDRALSFDRDARYPSAAAMRTDVEKVFHAGASTATPHFPPAQIAAVAITKFPTEEPASFAGQMSTDDFTALCGLFEVVDKALRAIREHGRAQPKAIRSLDVAFRHAREAVSQAHIGLFWNVLEDNFSARQKEVVWKPQPPLEDVPGSLFRGGVRMLGLLPGIEKQEFEEVMRLLAGDLAPFSDCATMLQSLPRDHVVFRIEPVAKPESHDSELEPPSSDGRHVPSLITTLEKSDDPAMRATLLSKLERWGSGHEAKLGEILDNTSAELAMGVLRVLETIDTAEARAVMVRARTSPHVVVRISALAKLEPGGERLRAELRGALEDANPAQRVASLVGIEQYRIKAAGPALALRIRSAAFNTLPARERKQALAALGKLMPSRAETIALELLNDQRLIPGEAHEITRELAAETLGVVATSKEARDSLEAAAKGRWRTSERVRGAAQRALAAWNARDSEAPPPSRRSGRKTSNPQGSGPKSKRSPRT